MDELTHFLVPRHTKLSETEAVAVLEQYGVTVHDLPKISINDPALQHLNAKSGDVIKIERKSLTAGDTIFYRGVINE